MDALSSIFTWLSDHEAGISAVAAIIVIGGVVFAGFRWLASRRSESALEATPEKAPAAATEPPSAPDSALADLDPLTVPGFEGHAAIAVLPFDNLSGDPEQEYFADGIAEDLITRLSAWRHFPVIARNSSFAYKGKAVDVKQVSRELGVRYVVEGSVRKVGERVRISAQLIDATTGAHVWAQTYDRELRDVFALQDEITQAVVGSMHPELRRSEMQRVMRKDPQSLDAWDCFMRALWHAFQLTKADNLKAQQLFQQAIDLDSAFAEAFAGLAISHMSRFWHQWSDLPTESIAEMIRAARRSVELAPNNAEAQHALSLAHFVTGKLNEAIAAAERAIELNPSLANVYSALAYALTGTGRPEEALAAIEKAMRLSPRDPMMSMALFAGGFAHFASGRYEDAADWARRDLRDHPQNAHSLRLLAASCAHLGQLDEARAAGQEFSRLYPDWSLSAFRPILLTSMKDSELVEGYFDDLRKAGFKE